MRIAQAAAVRSQLGVLSHQPLLYGDLNAAENLRFYGRMYAVNDLEARIAEVLDLVGLRKRQRDLVRTFSRGEGSSRTIETRLHRAER